jgi:predicted phage tail protein
LVGAAFFDPHNGAIASYRVGLSTTADTLEPDIVPWRNVTLAEAASPSGAGYSWGFFHLSLVEGQRYYGFVQAVDRVGRLSVPVVTTGQV